MSPFVIYSKKKVTLVQKTWGRVNDKIFILCERWRWWIQSNAIYPSIIKDQTFYNKQNSPHIPEVRVVLFPAHDDGFKHGSLSYHKLNHSVYQAQQVPISHKIDGWENEQGHSLLFPPFLNHSIQSLQPYHVSSIFFFFHFHCLVVWNLYFALNFLSTPNQIAFWCYHGPMRPFRECVLV